MMRLKIWGNCKDKKWFKNNNPQENFEDDSIRKIEEIDNKKRALSEISVKPKKSLNSMVSKVASPFTVAPVQNRVDNSEKIKNEIINRNDSLNIKKEDRKSVDVWRASEVNENRLCEMETKQDSMGKDEILDQWLKRNPHRNGTITEDVDAENEEDSNRMSQSSLASKSDYRASEPKVQPQQQDEEEENELHKIHMLQSLQALQYLK